MKVFVLGHTGMLGHVAAAYLRQRGFEVLTTNARYTGLPADSLVAAVRESHAEWRGQRDWQDQAENNERQI